MDSIQKQDAEFFARTICKANIPECTISFGKFLLKGKKGVKGALWYNQDPIDLIQGNHDYTFEINDGALEISLQLWLNINSHYKFRAVTRINGKDGAVFSVNLSTQKESENVIYLTNKAKFTEKYDGDKKVAQARRQQKQVVFTDIIRKLDIDVTANNDIILGIFDPNTESFVNTTANKFLEDFMVISILKGHFMGNKGYSLEILPSYRIEDETEQIDENISIELPNKVIGNKSKRHIPLSYRYRVLRRDNFKCVACGNAPKDGVKLHIDHKTPFSLGGATEIKNLQTLCSDCNIGKSNKFIDV